MTVQTQTLRTIAGIVNSVETLEGAGFRVRRPFPKSSFSEFDPFLLLDELGPMDLGPGQAKGAPDHPHRGFETVSYILDGRLEHKDSEGHAGLLNPGDVQWMTAGAGVVHSEMPEAEFTRTGGRLHGIQLWVNLPRHDKMIAPRYQDIPAAKIPVAQTADGGVTVRVIAGESLGAKAVIETRTPIIYLHLTLQPGASLVQPVPPEYNAFAYLLDGSGLFGAEQERGEDGQMVIFAQDGGEVAIANPADAAQPLDLLLIAGVPLNEPVVRYGPFVMNTEAEIIQAIEDYRNGKMGQIHA
ncbi:pirin family protein [Pseudanabaena sp. FACHB-2040]|uniref:pirin family protein n=1 Tax=Pseudanabaena sp. FACHB-2040 TaxID=2692859 RepID=UPI0016891686|nr:pirin family protein [Pseudanabaena sp. FACHB-2040]MBD2256265.1 pirin family protein [Pseudanabaena sp. FACHB-2040]